MQPAWLRLFGQMGLPLRVRSQGLSLGASYSCGKVSRTRYERIVRRLIVISFGSANTCPFPRGPKDNHLHSASVRVANMYMSDDHSSTTADVARSLSNASRPETFIYCMYQSYATFSAVSFANANSGTTLPRSS